MVRERITDGERIAELLASELAGVETGRLAHVELVDAVGTAEPSSDGVRAYGVAYCGEPFASVELYPERVELRLERGEWPDDVTERDGRTLEVDHAAGVKGAVDAVRAALTRE